MEKELLQKIDQLEKNQRKMKAVYGLTLSVLSIAFLAFSFVKQEKFDIIRAKGIIIEDSLGKDRILLGAPIPASKFRVRTDTNLVRKNFASQYDNPDKYMGWYKNYRHGAVGMVVMNEGGFDRVQIGDQLSDANVGRRMFDMAGIVLNDTKGTECGGAGVNTLEDGTTRSGVGFDDDDGEALHMMTFEDGSKGIVIGGANGSLRIGMTKKKGGVIFDNKEAFTGIKYFNNEGELTWEQEMKKK